MKSMVVVLAVLMAAWQLPAQTNASVKLALIAGADEASAAVDLLTAKLSADNGVQLLERDEIDKVYREQGLSAANTDYLKLGRVLGADGLILFDVVRTGTTTNLTARLVAVKPGVILTDESFPWPMSDLTAWGGFFGGQLKSFLPKLKVSAGEAIPISVVNFHSSVSSDEARETERQLKLLAIQRLTREKQFFVLERQKMDRLGEEKELAVDDSPFWDGRYLLEGTVDQNGYTKDTLTIDGRLTPKGGQPLMFQVRGSRTNEAEIINQLVLKVNELLKVNPTVETWDAAAEAKRFYEEGQWALRWGMFAEAQAAADSAWALGKRDLDCATIRVKAYVADLETKTVVYHSGEGSDSRPGTGSSPVANEQSVRAEIQMDRDQGIYGIEDTGQPIAGFAYRVRTAGPTKVTDYVFALRAPDAGNVERAKAALELYYNFGRNYPDVVAHAPAAAKSDWGNLGIEDLNVASQVLQDFHFCPESEKAMADPLAGLRAGARAFAQWLAGPVQDSYFTGDRLVLHDDLGFIGQPNIFACEVKWGCFWQEHPEDMIARYRDLMRSPIFSYIHQDFWIRGLANPRLVAWNEADRARLPQIRDAFLGELKASTNVLWTLEAKALALADANDESAVTTAFTNLFAGLWAARDALMDNNVEVLSSDWGVEPLVQTMYYATDPTLESARNLYYSQYMRKLDAMDQDYGQTVAFKEQKQYLKTNTPYDFFAFATMFSATQYSLKEALELQPLVAAYESNLVAQTQNASFEQKNNLESAIGQVDLLKNNIDRLVKPPAPPAPAPVQTAAPVAARAVPVPVSTAANDGEMVTNSINVRKFLPIPLDGLIPGSGLETIDSSHATITAHHWVEGKLLLNFDFNLWNNKYGGASGSALAILDPATERWEIVRSPQGASGLPDHYYHRSTLFHGELYDGDGGQIKKYDRTRGQWQTLAISDGNNYELFPINGHLYAANQTLIFEIMDGGASTHILASTRRQPPLTVLDTRLVRRPILFAGPNHSLRASADGRIFTWTGSDWHDDFATPPASPEVSPEVNPDGILYRQLEQGILSPSLGCVATEATAPEQFLWQKQSPWAMRANPERIIPSPPTVWQMPPHLFLSYMPAALSQSNLYLLGDAPNSPPAGDTSILLCFSRGFQQPQMLYLKFDSLAGFPPRLGVNPTSPPEFPAPSPAWMLAAGDFLFFGRERSALVMTGPPNLGDNFPAGVWLLPRSQIEPIIAGQAKGSLGKYDRNHDGVIDAGERAAALDDPDFIKSQLDMIDANHNGRLDLGELAYFDVNQDRLLEPNEVAGIEIAQRLLAENELKTFDDNGDGVLNQTEFRSLCRSGFDVGFDADPVFWGFDENHDQKIDVTELTTFMTQWTREKLRPRPSGRLLSPVLITPGMFKDELEAYWRDPSSINRPPPHRRLTLERMQEFLRTHQMPNGPAQ